MTAARQERKSRPAIVAGAALAPILALILALILTPILGVGPASIAIGAATSEMVVVNRYTGLAIDGFDPVAYFIDAAPKTGRAELELRYGGAVWRFRNEGNRAAFAADPGVYAPQFGGHDPMAVARGAATAGHPELWLIAEKRLYLFYSDEAQAAFAKDPDGAIGAARRQWPDVQRALVR